MKRVLCYYYTTESIYHIMWLTSILRLYSYIST